MNRRNIAIRTSLLGLLTGVMAMSGQSHAQSNADYAAQPQFISNVVTPNIIILMDNSGSMSNRACESTSCGILPGGGTSTSTTFTNTTQYSGYFDPMKCYSYDTSDVRFEENSTKATLATACSNTTWDGNFLNWATFRRFDAVKKALVGGNCSVARNADGTCPSNGSPSLKTVQAQATGVSTEIAQVNYNAGAGANTYTGRIPTADTTGNPGTIYIDVDAAYFCVDNDNSFNNNCGDSFSLRKYELKVGYSTEPTGVIQQVGSKARFGLAVFSNDGSNNGMRVLTGAGSRQSIDFAGNTVETFNTNTAAMVDAVDEAFPSTWTPLAESLYDVVRYVAQINSSYYPAQYVYPIAFSGGVSNGVNFATNGVGSVGTTEITALAGGETCPAGYISNACGRDPYFFGKNHTPAWASNSQQVNCCKTFVIVFTDGEPTQDLGIPAALQDYGHAHHGIHCTNSDTAAPPRPIDGTCNANAATPFNELLGEHKTDYASNGSGYLDSVAYWAHVNDMRPCNGTADGTIAVINVTGHCLSGTQNVTVYTFFAFGNINGRSILSQTAKLGAFEDSNNDGIPQTNEWDKENNITGAGTPDGIPDAYFESSNVDDLQDKMLATIASILRKSAAGSSVSVLATSTTGEGALYQSYFYPSTIEPATLKDVTWIGYTQSLFIDTFGNLREDSNGDKKMIYKDDKILKTYYDQVANIVKVDYYDDLNSDGLPDDKDSNGIINNLDCNPCGQSLGSIKPVWEAGKQLALKDSSTRTLLTWVDSNNDGIVDAGEQINFSTANSATLSPYLRAGAAPYTADNIIEYIRGCEPSVCTANQYNTLRDRQLQTPAGSGTLKTWKLGDLIHSTPMVVASPQDRFDAVYGDLSYQAFLTKYFNRRQVIYAGANDGMLHAFNGGFYHAGDDPSTGTAAAPIVEHGWFTRTPTDNSSGPQLGDELWGFIPYQLLPQLQWLTRADYQHTYFVDLQPTVADVRIFTPDVDHPNGWGTILIGGFRMGGSCNACVAGTGAPKLTVNISGTPRDFLSAYFVLDITNPEVSPKLLFSFADTGLGLTTSLPTVVRVNPTGDNKVSNVNAKWYMVVGSGPTGYQGNSSQSSKAFAVNLATGPGANNGAVQRFDVGSINAFVGDMTSFDRDLDYRTDVIYFGRVLDGGVTPWRGKLYRLTTGSATPFGGQTSASQWGIASGATRVPTEMLDTFPCDPTPCAPASIQMGPIVSAPSLAVDDTAKVWVFVGSGRYFSASDKTDTSTQYFVGVKDSVVNTTCTQTSQTSCWTNNLLNVSNATVCVLGVGNCGQTSGTNQVTGVSGATSFTSLMALIKTKDGWYTQLPQTGTANGERVLSSPLVLGGIVFFPTFIPTLDICATSGTSYLYALYYKTGTAYESPIIGTSAGASGNQNVNNKTSLGEGLAFGAVAHMGSGSDGGTPFKLFNNTSTGNLPGTDTNLAGEVRSHYLTWINR